MFISVLTLAIKASPPSPSMLQSPAVLDPTVARLAPRRLPSAEGLITWCSLELSCNGKGLGVQGPCQNVLVLGKSTRTMALTCNRTGIC